MARGNCVTDWIFRRSRFCCCLPVRIGAGLMAFLTLILSGLLMIVLWFEVHSNYFMSNREKVAFIVAGVIETFLFIASLLGFIGVCAKKQLFVVVYVTFLYAHFLVNFGVAAYFLWEVTHTANKDIVAVCEETVRNSQAKDQCRGLFNIAKGAYWGFAIVGLAVEAYCTLIVTRYLNQLRYEKREGKRSRHLARQSAYDAFHKRFSSFDEPLTSPDAAGDNKHRYSTLSTSGDEPDMDNERLLAHKPMSENETPISVPHFNPYEAYDKKAQKGEKEAIQGTLDRRGSRSSAATTATVVEVKISREASEIEVGPDGVPAGAIRPGSVSYAPSPSGGNRPSSAAIRSGIPF